MSVVRGVHEFPIHPPTNGQAADAPDVFPLQWFRDIKPVLSAGDFVRGVLVGGTAAVIYGASNSGKTFFVTDLALHVAAGFEWFGRRVEQGGVIYCALEGGHGFQNRVSAWREDRGLGNYDLPFAAICSQPLNLLDPNADTEPLIATIVLAQRRMAVPCRMVVIDTLARAIAGGNENASEDMGALVGNIDRIRKVTGAQVTFVHHSGKNAAMGARGHSSLQAAIDTEIEVIEDQETSTRFATVVKQRDLRKGDVFAFHLRTVEVGENEHGETVTTCVVQAEAESTAVANNRKARHSLVGHEKHAFGILEDLIGSTGETGHNMVPSETYSVPEQWWRERWDQRAMPGANDATKQRAFIRASEHLVQKQVVGMAGNRVWIVREAR